MKLQNILSIACLIFATIACSTENDALNSLPNNKEVETANGDAFIAFNINAEMSATKSNSTNTGSEKAEAIDNCSLILFENAEGSKIYRAYDQLNVNNGVICRNNDALRLQVKLNTNEGSKKLYAMVVANSNQSFANCSNLADVQATVQNDLNSFVKINKDNKLAEINIEEKDLASSINSAVPVTANITLQEISARVELAEFNIVSFKGGNATPVSIKNIALVNQVIATGTKINDTENRTYNEEAVYFNNGSIELNNNIQENTPAQTTFTGISFPTFANTNKEQATALKFTLEYNGQEKEFSFAINREENFTNNSGHKYIESGNVYKVVINATLTGSSIECEYKCYTEDWSKVELSENVFISW